MSWTKWLPIGPHEVGVIVGLAILAVGTNLSGCASMPAAPPPIVKTICVPVATYSAAQQAAMADELAKLPDADPLALAMVDYGRERAALRACAKP